MARKPKQKKQVEALTHEDKRVFDFVIGFWTS